MKPTRRLFSFSFFIFLCFGCGQTQESTKDEDQSPGKKFAPIPVEALDPEKMVPVGSCRVVARVLSIDPVVSGGGDDPCSKAPCVAMVRIDSVLGCGSGAQGSLSSGSTVRARFATTLGPSKDLFPQLNPPLPGLKEGSVFKALVRGGPEAAGYSIDAYEVR